MMVLQILIICVTLVIPNQGQGPRAQKRQFQGLLGPENFHIIAHFYGKYIAKKRQKFRG